MVRVLHAPQCLLERLPDDEAGQRRVGCEVTAGDPPALRQFSWSADNNNNNNHHQEDQEEGDMEEEEFHVSSRHNYSVMTLPSSSRSFLQETTIRCGVSNTVGRAECHIALPAKLAVLNSSTPVIIMVAVPAVLAIIITSLAIIFCLNKLATSNQKYFVSGRSN